MSIEIKTRPLTAAEFANFGDVLELKSEPDVVINQGFCGRHHDLAKLDFGSGKAGISLFDAKPRKLPYQLDMVERHPEGSQAFIPMSLTSFLIIVAVDNMGAPHTPVAFVSSPGQAINFHRGTWHGVLTPLHQPGLFAVVDRVGTGENLQEHWFAEKYLIV